MANIDRRTFLRASTTVAAGAIAPDLGVSGKDAFQNTTRNLRNRCNLRVTSSTDAVKTSR
jgi:hypothetical protein